jgi:hypothetical protein
MKVNMATMTLGHRTMSASLWGGADRRSTVMSDMSSLSHEYASATDFSRQINDALLLLKKQQLGGTFPFDDTAEKLRGARELLHQTVLTLLQRLKREKGGGDAAVLFPEDVLVRIEARHAGNVDYFRQDLVELERDLSSDSELSNEQLELLDSICEAADASASATFRKLWRR